MQVNNYFSYVLVLILSIVSYNSNAQDAFPLHAEMQKEAIKVYPLTNINLECDLQSFSAHLPKGFKVDKENRIVDSTQSLNSFFDKLRQDKLGNMRDSIRVLHVGDSHIKGHFFTRKIGESLSSTFSSLLYHDFGINGAVVKTFNQPERLQKIMEYKPDLLVLSFGTNESHNRRYNADIHYIQLDEFINAIRTEMPNLPILLTTPPGSYERRGRKNYRINPRTGKAVNLIKTFAKDKNLAYWDMYSLVGGESYACKNWTNAKLMRPDHIHYLPEGYELQAELFCEALIKAYNEFITL